MLLPRGWYRSNCLSLVFYPQPHSWGYSHSQSKVVASEVAGINLVFVSHTKPMQRFFQVSRPTLCCDFDQIFRKCLPLKDPELIKFWRVFSNNCFYGNTFFRFLRLIPCGCSTNQTYAVTSTKFSGNVYH